MCENVQFGDQEQTWNHFIMSALLEILSKFILLLVCLCLQLSKLKGNKQVKALLIDWKAWTRPNYSSYSIIAFHIWLLVLVTDKVWVFFLSLACDVQQHRKFWCVLRIFNCFISCLPLKSRELAPKLKHRVVQMPLPSAYPKLLILVLFEVLCILDVGEDFEQKIQILRSCDGCNIGSKKPSWLQRT